MRYLRSSAVAAMAVAVVVIGSSPAQAASTPAYKVANVGAYGGEPSIVSDNLGQLYDTTPSGGTITYTSTNKGASWTQVTTADPASGDDCLATDQSNAVYLCNLAGSEGVAPLQADVWKSIDHGTTWTHGAGTIPQCAHELLALRCRPRLGRGIHPGRRHDRHRRGRAHVPRLLRTEPDLGEHLARRRRDLRRAAGGAGRRRR